MKRPSPSWFSHGVQWNADISYTNYGGVKTRGKLHIFSSDDRDDAIAAVFKDARRYGFTDININKLMRVG